MAAVTLQEVFGPSATLTGGVLSITIADFTGVGLSAASTSAADIYAAMMLRLKSVQPTDAADDTTRGVVVGSTDFKTISRNDTQLERQYTLSFYTPLNISAFDPDDVV